MPGNPALKQLTDLDSRDRSVAHIGRVIPIRALPNSQTCDLILTGVEVTYQLN